MMETGNRLLHTNHASTEDLIKWSADGKLYALVDSHFSAWKRGSYYRLNPKDTDPIVYDQVAWEDVQYIAPIVFRVEPHEVKYFIDELSHQRWGLFFRSDSNCWNIAQHFQKFVIAEGPEGDPYFFKYQDAAVLEVFFETWTHDELEKFFGPVESVGFWDMNSHCYQFMQLSRAPIKQFEPEDLYIHLKASQLQACRERIASDQIKVIAHHLKKIQPHLVEGLSDFTLEERVAFGVKKAKSYQLESVGDLLHFVGLLFEVAPHFDEHPKIRSLLASPHLNGSQKLGVLSHAVTAKEWQEASLLFDEKFWPRPLKRTG